MRNCDVIRFCFDNEIRRVGLLGVRNVQKKPIQHVSLNEIDIQSQRLAENVLNHASILLSNRIQLFFRCAMDFQLSQW